MSPSSSLVEPRRASLHLDEVNRPGPRESREDNSNSAPSSPALIGLMTTSTIMHSKSSSRRSKMALARPDLSSLRQFARPNFAHASNDSIDTIDTETKRCPDVIESIGMCYSFGLAPQTHVTPVSCV